MASWSTAVRLGGVPCETMEKGWFFYSSSRVELLKESYWKSFNQLATPIFFWPFPTIWIVLLWTTTGLPATRRLLPPGRKVESVYRDQHLRRLVAVMHQDTDFAETGQLASPGFCSASFPAWEWEGMAWNGRIVAIQSYISSSYGLDHEKSHSQSEKVGKSSCWMGFLLEFYGGSPPSIGPVDTCSIWMYSVGRHSILSRLCQWDLAIWVASEPFWSGWSHRGFLHISWAASCEDVEIKCGNQRCLAIKLDSIAFRKNRT